MMGHRWPWIAAALMCSLAVGPACGGDSSTDAGRRWHRRWRGRGHIDAPHVFVFFVVHSSSHSHSASTGVGGNGGNGAGGAGGSGHGGNGGAGGSGGGVVNSGPPAQQLVNSGAEISSPNYKMNFTLGQPTQNQGKTTSPNYRMQGGLIGANGSLP